VVAVALAAPALLTGVGAELVLLRLSFTRSYFNHKSPLSRHRENDGPEWPSESN
jgi:hypothetical protein